MSFLHMYWHLWLPSNVWQELLYTGVFTFTVPLVDNWCAGVAVVLRIDECGKGAGVAAVKVHHGGIGRLAPKPSPHCPAFIVFAVCRGYGECA